MFARNRLRAALLLIGLSGGAGGGAWAAPDPAQADVADWAPADTQAALVVRHGDQVGRQLEALHARFGQTRTLAGVVARLQAFETAGLRPFAGHWGDGIDPKRGIGLFAVEKGSARARVVVGLSDPVAARKTLATLVHALAPEATFDGARFDHDGKTLHCAERGPWLVCDAEAVPDAPPGRPDFLSADAWLEVAVREGAAKELASDFPMVGLNIRLAPTADGGRLAVAVEVDPTVLAALDSLKPADGPIGGGDCVDRRAGFIGRLSVDAQRLFAAHGALIESAVPAAERPLWHAARAALTGELLFSTAGGLSHPVISIGVRDAAAGIALMKAEAAALQAAGLPTELGPDFLQIDVPTGEGERLRFTLRYGVTATTLVWGLAAADVARCVDGKVQARPLPEPLAGKGSTGFVTWAVPTGSLPPGAVEMVGGLHPVVSDVLTVAGVYLRLLGELGFQVQPGPKGLNASLWWSLR